VSSGEFLVQLIVPVGRSKSHAIINVGLHAPGKGAGRLTGKAPLYRLTTMGTDSPRLTQQSLRVLRLFSEDHRRPLAGADIMKATGLASGTLYPILLRFENYGLLESDWEHGTATRLGRPRRRFYSITLEGRAVAREALAELSVPFLVPAITAVRS
jgi:PadR family transcriptional regulator